MKIAPTVSSAPMGRKVDSLQDAGTDSGFGALLGAQNADKGRIATALALHARPPAANGGAGEASSSWNSDGPQNGGGPEKEVRGADSAVATEQVDGASPAGVDGDEAMVERAHAPIVTSPMPAGGAAAPGASAVDNHLVARPEAEAEGDSRPLQVSSATLDRPLSLATARSHAAPAAAKPANATAPNDDPTNVPDDAKAPHVNLARQPALEAAAPSPRSTAAEMPDPASSADQVRDTLASTAKPVTDGRSLRHDDRGKNRTGDRAAAHSGAIDGVAPNPPAMPLVPAAEPADHRVQNQVGGADGDAHAHAHAKQSPSVQMLPSAPAPEFKGDADPSQPQPRHDTVPSLLASQAPAGPIARPMPATQPYGVMPQLPAQPVIAAQPGRIGRELGVEIARQVSDGKQEVLVRLDPAEMGRIDVRLSFDDKGHLHAAMTADSATALDMLRRDAGDLGRALANAGVHSDPSTFRFDTRHSDTSQLAHHNHTGGQRGDPQHHHGERRRGRGDSHAAIAAAPYRRLRTNGQVDLTA